jgi:predicted membrane channel-forming protein YqfA (hemolysin III family)
MPHLLSRRAAPPILAILGTALLAAVTATLVGNWDARLWEGMELGKAALENEYCEANHMADFVRQPVNAWSNLCYFLIGLWVIGWAVQDATAKRRANPLQRFPAMTLWVGLMQVGLCFGSFFFHASLTKTGQHWDMAFTYGLSLSLAFGAAYRLLLDLGITENARTKAVTLLLTIGATVVVYLIKWRLDGRIALPAMMLSGLVLVVIVYFRLRAKLNGWLLVAGIVALILSAVFRSLDLAKVGCAPMGWMQLHACWHLCTGLAAFFFLAFLHAEKP